MPPKVVYSARRTTEDPDNEAATQERSVESTARTDEGTEARLSGGGPAEETMEDIEADEVRSEVAVLEDEDEEDLEPAAAAREAFDPRAISDEQVEENEFARALARRGYAGLLKHAYRKSQEADRAITRDVPYKHFQAVGFEIDPFDANCDSELNRMAVLDDMIRRRDELRARLKERQEQVKEAKARRLEAMLHKKYELQAALGWLRETNAVLRGALNTAHPQ